MSDRYNFTGRELVMGNGYYYRTRNYDSLAGVFYARDTLGFAANDTNLFRYTNNSPNNAIDPNGTDLLGESQLNARAAKLAKEIIETIKDTYELIKIAKTGTASLSFLFQAPGNRMFGAAVTVMLYSAAFLICEFTEPDDFEEPFKSIADKMNKELFCATIFSVWFVYRALNESIKLW